jgi:HNH endonuclease/AP2 domain
MKTIELTQGYVALIDDEDYARASQFKWQAQVTPNSDRVYAVRTARKANVKRTMQRLHRFILGVTDPKIEVDHINRNGLDNQKSNLRICTVRQNQGNRRKQEGTTSIYKGVSWHRASKKWQAMIRINEKYTYLGLFRTDRDAALIYDCAARKVFGEFALTNFQEDTCH